MRFFFDNTLSPHLARAVGALENGLDGHEVIHLKSRFAPDTPDVTWIRALGEERDWVIVSGDLRITRIPAEREAWRASGLTAFFLKRAWADQELVPFASRFIAWWPKITSQAQMAPVGKGFLVPFGGQRFEDPSR